MDRGKKSTAQGLGLHNWIIERKTAGLLDSFASGAARDGSASMIRVPDRSGGRDAGPSEHFGLCAPDCMMMSLRELPIERSTLKGVQP